MTPMHLVLMGSLSAWLLVAAYCNITGRGKSLRVKDYFALIPQWCFFAPRPIEADVLLFYRDGMGSVFTGAWREIPAPRGRRPFTALWNPEKRYSKAVFDAVMDLGSVSRDLGYVPETIGSYLLVLNYISCLSRPYLATHVQFAVLSGRNESLKSENRIVFLSNVHRLAGVLESTI